MTRLTNSLRFHDHEDEERRQRVGTGCLFLRPKRGFDWRQEATGFHQRPPPDMVVEVDVHHESLSKFPIYAALNVPEIWHYDGQALTIYHFRQDPYIRAESSLALPLLTGSTLTEFLSRSSGEDQYEILLTFESWLEAHPR